MPVEMDTAKASIDRLRASNINEKKSILTLHCFSVFPSGEI